MAPTNRANKKVANSLVAMSSAAVLAVYAAGYARTRDAADRFALQASDRRPAPARESSGGVRLQPDDSGGVRLQPDVSGGVRLQPDRPVQPDREISSTQPAPAPGHAAAVTRAATSSPTPSIPAAATAPQPAEVPAVTPVAPPTSATSVATEAQNTAEPAVAPVTPPKSEYKDGTYLGWGHCRHGDIQAQVVIAGGRIASATIAQCLTRYSCSVIDRLPPQVAQRQSPDVDVISGATQSGDAFYYAVLDALYLAK